MPADLFDDCAAELVEGGLTDGEARALLLDEAEWSEDVEGVQLIERRLCLHCREPLSPPREWFCDALCEAAFSVAVRE